MPRDYIPPPVSSQRNSSFNLSHESSRTTDPDGTITKVQFYNGATLLSTVTSAPYSYDWSGIPAGSYSITARATDNLNASTTSAPIMLISNSYPNISIKPLPNNANFIAPANITLEANAADQDGSIAKVEFFNGTTLISTATSAPYTAAWNNVGVGIYSVTAIVTDNLGAQTTSAPVLITVTPKVTKIFYIHSDHLGTPRIVTDAANQIVWRNLPTTEAFGNSPPEENPNGQGTFKFNLRFPGQYADRETNLNYNYFRDYDPATGRYVQSDPIGLAGGVNTFGYVDGSPLNYIDSLGLELVPISLPGLPNTYIDNEFKPKILDFIKNAQDQGVDLKFNYAYRSPSVQAALRNNSTAITPAKQSLHSCGFAVDVNFKSRPEDEQEKILKAAKDAGLDWGGKFKPRPDWPHFYTDPKFSRGEKINRALQEYNQLRRETRGQY